MKQTAVEWLAYQIQEQLDIFCPGGILDSVMIEQAKEMEKEQIIDALMTSEVELLSWGISAEQYYNQTFKSE